MKSPVGVPDGRCEDIRRGERMEVERPEKILLSHGLDKSQGGSVRAGGAGRWRSPGLGF